LEVKRRWLITLIWASLLALAAFLFIDPERMISPGSLAPGHAALEKDCFACHSPWRGAAPERCVKCHAWPDIGVRTTRGAVLVARAARIAFHQELIEQDCIACHGDHEGPITRRSRRPFSHVLLRATARDRCAACHFAPGDNVHRELAATCARCHEPEHWKPASFDHGLLSAAEQERCDGCHKPPADNLHHRVNGQCQQCHGQLHWKPVTLDHDRLFVLDSDHNAQCAICHAGDEYSRYACYGCHAHQPRQVRIKHIEQGIQSFENCAKCHRSARGEAQANGSSENREKD